jgi:hypothetical protein
MKRWAWIGMLAALAPATAAADGLNWDKWYDGEVETRLRLRGHDEGSVYAPGEAIRIEFKTNEDAYHVVYGIDTEGYVRVLFPRFWEDDGWVERNQKVKLRSEDLAWPADRWGADGIVYVEAVASPLPFEFRAAGFANDHGLVGWYGAEGPLRVNGDPFLAFNDIHQRLFPDWERAVFTVDYTYFYVGAVQHAPRYLGYDYQRVYVAPPHPGFYATVRFGWRWQFGVGYCRPIYRRYYWPGRHVVHHHTHRHHHVWYPERDRDRRVVRDWDGPRRRIKRDAEPRRRVPTETKRRVPPETKRRVTLSRERNVVDVKQRSAPEPRRRAVATKRVATPKRVAQPSRERTVQRRQPARQVTPAPRVKSRSVQRATPAKAPQRQLSTKRSATRASRPQVSATKSSTSRAAVKSKSKARSLQVRKKK